MTRRSEQCVLVGIGFLIGVLLSVLSDLVTGIAMIALALALTYVTFFDHDDAPHNDAPPPPPPPKKDP